MQDEMRALMQSCRENGPEVCNMATTTTTVSQTTTSTMGSGATTTAAPGVTTTTTTNGSGGTATTLASFAGSWRISYRPGCEAREFHEADIEVDDSSGLTAIGNVSPRAPSPGRWTQRDGLLLIWDDQVSERSFGGSCGTGYLLAGHGPVEGPIELVYYDWFYCDRFVENSRTTSCFLTSGTATRR